MASSLPDKLSPDAIDTLTELAAILAQLRPTVQSSTNIPSAGLGIVSLPSLSAPVSTPAAGTGAAPAPAPAPPPAVTGTTPLPTTIPSTASISSGTLGFKELPAATDNLKHKLQRARMSIRSLPDVSRTIEQQETEMGALEALKARQIAQMASLKGVGLDFNSLG